MPEYGRLNKDLTTSSKHRRAFSLSMAVSLFSRSMPSGGPLPSAEAIVAFAEALDEFVANGVGGKGD
jgi:hypothetical protein